MSSRVGWVGAIAVSLLMFSSMDAVAGGPNAKDKLEVKNLLAEAKTDMKLKKYAEAAKALARADELDPSPQTKLDLARALIPAGKLVDASKALNGASEAKGPAGKKVADAAKKLLAEVEPRVPWIQITVAGPKDDQTSTTIDGAEVDAKSETPFDPGEHVITADAEGYEHAEKHVSLAEGKHLKVNFTLTRSGPVETAAPVEKNDKGGGGGSVLPAALAFGVGAAGLGVGAVFGIMAFSETSKVQDSCQGTRCPPKVRDALDVAKTNGTVSTIGFVVGGLGVGTGIVLLLTSGGSAKPVPEGADKAATGAFHVSEVHPLVGPGQVGVVGRF